MMKLHLKESPINVWIENEIKNRKQIQQRYIDSNK